MDRDAKHHFTPSPRQEFRNRKDDKKGRLSADCGGLPAVADAQRPGCLTACPNLRNTSAIFRAPEILARHLPSDVHTESKGHKPP